MTDSGGKRNKPSRRTTSRDELDFGLEEERSKNVDNQGEVVRYGRSEDNSGISEQIEGRESSARGQTEDTEIRDSKKETDLRYAGGTRDIEDTRERGEANNVP